MDPTTGQSYLAVVVQSVQNNIAQVSVTNQGGRTLSLRRDFQQAKGPWPQPGEQWIIERRYANVWMFALLITPSQTPLAPPAVMAVSNQAERDAIVAPETGQLALRQDTRLLDLYDGSIWRGVRPAPVVSTGTITNTATVFASTIHGSLAVPDPGWPYRLRFGGYVRVAIGTATGLTINLLDGTTTGGAALITPFIVTAGSDANANARTRAIVGTTGSLTGSRTVSLAVLKTAGGGSDGWTMSDQNNGTVISAEVLPVP